MTNDQEEVKPLGMLLVGHGTRDARGVAEFLEAAALIGERMPGILVEAAFLELAEPTIDHAMRRLAERSVDTVVVVPLLLFAAGHAKYDIPEQVARSASSFANITIRYAEPLACHAAIIQASSDRFFAAVDSPTRRARSANTGLGEEAALVLVSRGTSDPAAIEQVQQFVAARRMATPTAEIHLGFMAVAEPSIDEVLVRVQQSTCTTIVIQPHLLFHGRVLQDLSARVELLRTAVPGKQFVMARHIGPCAQVAIAAIARFHAAVV